MKIKRLPQLQLTYRANWGRIIKTARIECGLSQTELSEAVGYKSATAISLMEDNKRKITVQTFFNILTVTDYLGEFIETEGLLDSSNK